MDDTAYLSALPLSDFLDALAEAHLKNGELINHAELKRRAQQAQQLERINETLRYDLQAANDNLAAVRGAVG